MARMRQDVARSVFAVLLGLAVIVPFLNYHRVSPSPTFYSEAAAAFFFLAAGAAGASLLPKRQQIDAWLAIFCFGLLAILGYQVASGAYYEFMMSWASWAAFLCLFFLATALGQLAAADPSLRTIVVDRLVAALVITALFNAFAQFAQLTEWSLQIRPIVFVPDAEHRSLYTCAPAGNIAQRNHTNAVAWLGIAGLLHALAYRRARPVFVAAGVAVLLGSSALTSSRMAWLMAAAVAASLLVAHGGIGWSRRRALAVGASLIAGLLVATVIRQWLVSGCQSSIERVVAGIGASGAAQPSDYWVRLEMLRQSIMVWWSQPIAGVGVGKFMARTFALEPSRDLVQPLDFYPHNTAVEILVSFGILGGALLLVCGTVWAVRIWRHRNASGDQWVLVAGLAVLCVPAFLELALWFSYFFVPFGLMLGLAMGPVPATAPALRLPWRWLFPAAALIGVPALTLAARDHLQAERVYWLSQVARAPNVFSGAAQKRIPEVVSELSLFAVWGEYEMLRFGTQRRDENLPAQLAANQRLMDNIPDPHIVTRQMMLETLAGRPDEARDLFRRLMVFFPEHYKASAEALRKRAEAQPDDAGELLKILDEEMARPPRRRE